MKIKIELWGALSFCWILKFFEIHEKDKAEDEYDASIEDVEDDANEDDNEDDNEHQECASEFVTFLKKDKNHFSIHKWWCT